MKRTRSGKLALPKFSQEFEQELKQLNRLIDASERHVPYLLRKAELIDEYQRGNG